MKRKENPILKGKMIGKEIKCAMLNGINGICCH